jgi:predicted nucleotide-binding protein (sugar kinase/HSP70/actin superfamily)
LEHEAIAVPRSRQYDPGDLRKSKTSVHFDRLIEEGPPPEDVIGTYPGIGVMSELIDGLDQVVDFEGRLIKPEPNSQRTLDLASRYAPEGACLPFKLIMGNLMQSLDRGANTVGMITECGPCRLGFYSLAMRMIFSDLGLGNGWLEFDDANMRKGYVQRFRDSFRKTHGRGPSLWTVLIGFVVGLQRISAVERLQQERNRLLVYEREKGEVLDVYKRGLRAIQQTETPFQMRRARRAAFKALRAVPVDMTRDAVRVVLTGEVYCIVDPFANGDVEMRLARLGAEPVRVLWQVNYLLSKLHLDHFKRISHHKALRAAKKYLPEDIGGDCNSNVGHALLGHQRGDDGMVHIKPFGCMLEFVAENILRSVEKDTGFPILSLTLDDLTGEERVNVRLEAFVDTLFQRKYERDRKAGGK